MNLNHVLSIIFFLNGTLSGFAQFSAEGGLSTPYSYEGNFSGTGIKNIFIYNTFSGATLSYTTDEINVEFYKYTRSISDKQRILDGDIDIPIQSRGTNTTYTIKNLEDSRGYFIEINGIIKDVTWVIDYAKHETILNSIEPVESGDKCEYLKLLVNKSDDLFFYANGGGVHRINRMYQLEYNNLKWNEKNKEFEEEKIIGDPVNVGTDIDIPAPLLDTEFKLKGDQIAQHFNIEKSVVSKPYTSVAVEAHMITEQTSTEDETGSTSSLGGSAPVDINFYGYGNEPTSRYYTWYIYKKTDLENPIQRYTDKDIKYTFKEAGDYLIQLDIIDRSSTCTSTATKEFNITEFEWDAPNFMIVDGEHEFKISYKSIIKFKCSIFNRWNQKIYEWTDPSQGWDGKYKGRYVNTGVYFYVMTSVSGDGKTNY